MHEVPGKQADEVREQEDAVHGIYISESLGVELVRVRPVLRVTMQLIDI